MQHFDQYFSEIYTSLQYLVRYHFIGWWYVQ